MGIDKVNFLSFQFGDGFVKTLRLGSDKECLLFLATVINRDMVSSREATTHLTGLTLPLLNGSSGSLDVKVLVKLVCSAPLVPVKPLPLLSGHEEGTSVIAARTEERSEVMSRILHTVKVFGKGD